MIEIVKKRDGTVVPFERDKVKSSITRAAKSVRQKIASNFIEEKVLTELEKEGKEVSVERIQDILETVLMEFYPVVAKSFILYRQKRSLIRKTKSLLGVQDDLKLPLNSVIVLEKRYLQRDEKNKVVETPRQMFTRVAKAIATVEKNYGKTDEQVSGYEKEFYDMMSKLEFLPNSPTLMNAGTGKNLNLSACFVIPVEDSIASIFEAIKTMAIIQKAGGGVGFSFSKIRCEGDIVRSTSGIASGPISFMTAFDAATEVIKQGGKRRGANMGILRVDHPDILDFIVCKEKEGILRNFNISVALTEKFMEAVEKDKDFTLTNPRGEVSKKMKARVIWNLLTTMAWRNGEPGVIFIDVINKKSTVPGLGDIESTNPCGEVPLLPYESCNLGSVNLSKFVIEEKEGPLHLRIDTEKLRKVVRLSIRFLDNVIDANVYPLAEIEAKTKITRKIGLGVMGFADMLVLLEIPYNSPDAKNVAEYVMKFIQDEARKMSEELGLEKGSFPSFEKSIFKDKYKTMRNATVTTVAPTGTIGVIAGCSSGIEPLFSIAYVRDVLDSLGSALIEINPYFETTAIKEGFYSEELINAISGKTSIQDIEEIPGKTREIFKTAHDISPETHVKMQAIFQEYTDNAVSKTINFPYTASPYDIEKAYWLAYKNGCKGITVYRDGSREVQVLKSIKLDT